MQAMDSVSHLWQFIRVQLQNFMLDLKQKVDAVLTDDKVQKERVPLGVSHLFHCFKPTVIKKQIAIEDVSFPSSTWNRDNSMPASEVCHHAAPIERTMQRSYKSKMCKKF